MKNFLKENWYLYVVLMLVLLTVIVEVYFNKYSTKDVTQVTATVTDRNETTSYSMVGKMIVTHHYYWVYVDLSDGSTTKFESYTLYNGVENGDNFDVVKTITYFKGKYQSTNYELN